MVIYNPGDVIYAAFPFTDVPTFKRRPIVCVSKSDYQKHTQHVLGVMVTTAKESQWYNDLEITNLKSAGLNHKSFVRFKIFTLPEDLIIKPLGKLSDTDLKSFKTVLQEIVI